MFGRAKRLFDHLIFSDQLPLDKRVCNLVAGFALLASVLSSLLRILEKAHPLNTLSTLMLVVISIAFLIYSNIYHKYRVGMTVSLALACYIVFPLIFFTSSGAGSGIVGYFVLSFVLIVMLIPGRSCAIMLGINAFVVAACYISDYILDAYYPALLSGRVNTSFALHLDNAHGYLSAGLFIGALIKFQAKIHIEEQRKAESALEAKAAFLANVSHVIRTPLNAIMGISELALRKDMPESTHDNLEKINRSGQTLLNIINDILDISRIESGEFQLTEEDYEVASSINDTISLNIVRIGSKKIKFHLEIDHSIPSMMRGDELRVKQILNNILSNAFKYTQEGEVRFKIDCTRDGDIAWVSFSVADTGIGIRESDMGRLFADFARFNTHAGERQEGTGLGLSIAKNLTEMMGGAIVVASEYGKGSTFSVVLPQRIVDDTPLGAETADQLARRLFVNQRRGKSLDHAQMPNIRVLLVDDVDINLMVAQSMLEPYGLAVDCVSSGAEAVRIIAEHAVHYDAIFMDHMMPGMDGIEAVRIIREEIGTAYAANIPIIALTANALVGNEEMFLANGFQAFLSKPIDSLRLDEILHAWVKSEPDIEEEANERQP